MRKTLTKIGSVVVVLILIFSVSPSLSQSQTAAPLPQSKEELQALIQILLARLAELQAQVASRTGGTGYTFTRNLTLGSIGPDVQALQSFLAQRGFMALPTGTAYGKFGPKTQAGLAAFQRARRITPVAGFFGPTTRAVVNRENVTLAVNGQTFGSGGSGNAPTTPRRTGGGGGGGGGSSSSNNNNTNPQPTGNGECSDGNDNDSDGLTDYPIDPGCSSDTASEGSNPTIDVTYMYKHWPIGAISTCTGSGTSFTCNPTSNFHNVIYPWVLDWRNGSLDPHLAKAYMDALPEGGRGMFSWVMDSPGVGQGHFYRNEDNCVDSNGNTLTYTNPGPYSAFIGDDGATAPPGAQIPYRCPWMDDWYSIIQPRWENFFRDYAAIGGKVDVVTIDNEVASGIAFVDWTSIPSILANPKFTQTDTKFPADNLARGSMQSKMGNLATLLGNRTNCDAVGCVGYATMFLWDWFNSYMNGATYDSVREYFPDVAVTNFGTTAYNYDQYKLPIYNYSTSCLSGSYCSDGVLIGNYQQPGMMYGPNVAHPGTLFDDVHPYRNTPFSKLREDAAFVKISRLSNPDSGMAPLYASPFYTNSLPTGTYTESIFHSLAAGSDFLNNWHDGSPTVEDERIMSEAMDEFDSIAGFEDKETLMFEDDDLNDRYKRTNPSAWNDDYLLTGIRSGGRHVWRFTPETGLAPEIPNAASTLISNDPPTFRTGTKRITFPQGVIYTPANPKSTLGYWVVQPDGMFPVITDDSDINIPPIAVYYTAYTNEGPGHVLFNSQSSHDPDGPSISREFDFNNDGVYGDAVVAFDYSEFPLSWALDSGWIMYRFSTTGQKTVGLKVTDTQGAVTYYRRTFTVPATACAHSVFSGQCEIINTSASAEVGSSNLAQAYKAFTEPINSFWRHVAGAVLSIPASVIGILKFW